MKNNLTIWSHCMSSTPYSPLWLFQIFLWELFWTRLFPRHLWSGEWMSFDSLQMCLAQKWEREREKLEISAILWRLYKKTLFLNGSFMASFILIFVFSIQLRAYFQYDFLPMTRFEPLTCGVGRRPLYQLSHKNCSDMRKHWILFRQKIFINFLHEKWRVWHCFNILPISHQILFLSSSFSFLDTKLLLSFSTLLSFYMKSSHVS